jgi:hypothetical protein
LKELCATRGMGLGQLLKVSGVSRTAYYSLARKDSVLPASLVAIARKLQVAPSAFLEEESRVSSETLELLALAEEIVRAHPGSNPDNVRHTLILLRKKPIERLRRSLLRGQTADIHESRTRVPA